MATDVRLKTLEKLQSQLPGAVQQGAATQESARIGALQEAVRSAGPEAGLAQARAIGQGLASQAGKDQLSRVTSAITEEQAKVGIAAEAGAQQAKEKLFRKQELLARLGEKNRQRLFDLNKSVTNDIIDRRSQLAIDAAGKRYMNEKQLMDYKILTAQSEEDLKDYAQKLNTYSRRKLQVMETVSKKLAQAKEQAFRTSEQELDQASKERLFRIAEEFDKKLAEEKKKAAKRAGLSGAVMTAGGGLMASGNPYAMIVGGVLVAAETLGPEGTKPSQVLEKTGV